MTRPKFIYLVCTVCTTRPEICDLSFICLKSKVYFTINCEMAHKYLDEFEDPPNTYDFGCKWCGYDGQTLTIHKNHCITFEWNAEHLMYENMGDIDSGVSIPNQEYIYGETLGECYFNVWVGFIQYFKSAIYMIIECGKSEIKAPNIGVKRTSFQIHFDNELDINWE